MCSQVRETSQIKHLDITGESQKEFMRLQEDKRHLQEQVEVSCGFVKLIIFFVFSLCHERWWCYVQTLGVREEEHGAETE